MINIRSVDASSGPSMMLAPIFDGEEILTGKIMALISDQKIAILAHDGVSQSELGMVRERLEKAGIHVSIVSPKATEIKAWEDDDWGIRIKVDRQITEVNAEDFDGILIPGGLMHADKLRESDPVLDLVRQMFAAGKLIGAIGHGIQILIDAESVEGRQVTSEPSLKTDLTHAGAIWADQDVVNDNGLVTARFEKDLESFNKVFLEVLRKGIRQRSATII